MSNGTNEECFSWNSKMRSLNNALSKAMPLLTPIGVVLGIVLGKNVAWMKPAVTPLFGVLTFSGALSISAKDFNGTIKKPKFIICYVICSLIAMPLLTYALSLLFFPSSMDLRSGFVAVRAIPTAVVGTVWSSIYSGNMAISIALVTLDTLIAPFTTPFIIKLLAKTTSPVDASGMLSSLIIMVLLPSILGMICNQIKGGVVRIAIHPSLRPISKLMLPFVIMVSSSSVSEKLIEGLSSRYILIGLFALFLCLLGYCVSLFGSRLFKFNEKDTVSMTFAIAMRNTTAALVIAIDYMPPDAALPVIFCIVFQQMTGSIVASFVFGHKKEEAAMRKGV